MKKTKKNPGGRPKIYTLKFCMAEITEMLENLYNDKKLK